MHDDYYCDENKLVLCKDVLGYDKVIAEKYALYLEKLHSKGVYVLLKLLLPLYIRQNIDK